MKMRAILLMVAMILRIRESFERGRPRAGLTPYTNGADRNRQADDSTGGTWRRVSNPRSHSCR